jgi:hypothetical protein
MSHHKQGNIMNKKIVRFTGNVMFIHNPDKRAALVPLDHPDTVNVSNNKEVITSPVVTVDTNDQGLPYRVETQNTIYVRVENEQARA